MIISPRLCSLALAIILHGIATISAKLPDTPSIEDAGRAQQHVLAAPPEQAADGPIGPASSGVAFYPPLSFSTEWLSRQGIPGEPLNVIISGDSHPSVLRDDGLIRYAKKLGFAPECLNIHLGEPQSANLNDGNGWSEQLLEIRQAYFPIFGSCLASAVGGNHFRAWKQNGTDADSEAWFLAVSTEYDYRKKHKTRPNGYDEGRDLIVSSARQHTQGYVSAVEYQDLIRPGRRFNHGIGTDGKVAVITVNLY